MKNLEIKQTLSDAFAAMPLKFTGHDFAKKCNELGLNQFPNDHIKKERSNFLKQNAHKKSRLTYEKIKKHWSKKDIDETLIYVFRKCNIVFYREDFINKLNELNVPNNTQVNNSINLFLNKYTTQNGKLYTKKQNSIDYECNLNIEVCKEYLINNSDFESLCVNYLIATDIYKISKKTVIWKEL